MVQKVLNEPRSNKHDFQFQDDSQCSPRYSFGSYSPLCVRLTNPASSAISAGQHDCVGFSDPAASAVSAGQHDRIGFSDSAASAVSAG
jgi:hypothetical protein